MLAVAPKLGHAEYPSSLPPSLWWRPAKVAIHDGKTWKTFYADYTTVAKLNASSTVAVSPLDKSGRAHYLAFDVDSGGIEAVRKLLSVLPPGTRPLISRSGGRNGAGFHVWLFLDRPLEVQTAVCFLRLVLSKAGISEGVETFPSSRNAKPLKLPGSQHPETKVCEDFVNLATGEECDTLAVWQMLIDGYYRTPAHIVEEYVKANAPAKAAKQQRQAKARTAREATTWLASQERLCDYLLQLAGRQPVRVGKAFRCILPHHTERHPSAAFHRTEDGRILYHDFHQRQGESWYTLGEVFYALTTGEVKKLKRHEAARWLAMLALQAGVFSEAASATKKKLETLSSTFFKFLSKAFGIPLESLLPSQEGWDLICQVVCKNFSTTDQSKGRRNQVSTPEALLRVWEVFTREALITAQTGFVEVNSSARFLAKEAGLALDVANRGVNLLACLGFVKKVPRSGGRKGDRFIVSEVAFEEVWQCWLALAQPSLRQFKAELVQQKLGPEVAASIFRRQSGTVKRTVGGTVSQTVTGTVHETASATNELQAIEAAIKRLSEEVASAERAGDITRANDLMRRVVALAKKKKELLGGAHFGSGNAFSFGSQPAVWCGCIKGSASGTGNLAVASESGRKY